MAEAAKTTPTPVKKKPVKKAKPVAKKSTTASSGAAGHAHADLEKKLSALEERIEALEASKLNIEPEKIKKEFQGRFANAEKDFREWIKDAPLQKVLLIVGAIVLLFWIF